jgi:hypothetical protein
MKQGEKQNKRKQQEARQRPDRKQGKGQTAKNAIESLQHAFRAVVGKKYDKRDKNAMATHSRLNKGLLYQHTRIKKPRWGTRRKTGDKKQ